MYFVELHIFIVFHRRRKLSSVGGGTEGLNRQLNN